MKLLIVCQYYYPEQFRVSDVSFKLASMGHEVTVLTGLPNYPAGNIFDGYEWNSLPAENIDRRIDAYVEVINGVKVVRCRLFPRKTGKINLFRNYLSFVIQASKTACSMLKEGMSDFDRILVFQFSPVTMAVPAIIFKRKIKKPLLLYCFDLWPDSIVSAGIPNHGLVYNFILEISKWIYGKADTILLSSKSFGKYFDEKLNIRIKTQYLPIYAEELFRHASKECGTADIDQTSDASASADTIKPVRLLFAGNIGEMQSLETIIHAAHYLKNHTEIEFHIVGDGSALQKSISLAKDLALNNIIFHGRHPLDAMPAFYHMADAFLVTLRKDPLISYTLPGKVQSYMAFGKPIIASIDGEAKETIKAAGCGLCCDAEDAESLAKIILNFAENKNTHRDYGECSKSYYQAHFSEESFYASLIGILNE